MKVHKSRELEEVVYKWYVQQHSASENVRELEIADAANKLAPHMGLESFKASDGWLWSDRIRHGMENKFERGESGSADISAVEPIRLKCNGLMNIENLHLGQLYKTDEPVFFWRSLPRSTQALKMKQ